MGKIFQTLPIVVPHSASSATQIWQPTKNNFCTLQLDYSADVTQCEVWSWVVVLVVMGKKHTHISQPHHSLGLCLPEKWRFENEEETPVNGLRLVEARRS